MAMWVKSWKSMRKCDKWRGNFVEVEREYKKLRKCEKVYQKLRKYATKWENMSKS